MTAQLPKGLVRNSDGRYTVRVVHRGRLIVDVARVPLSRAVRYLIDARREICEIECNDAEELARGAA